MTILVAVVAVGMADLAVGMVAGTGMIAAHKIGSWMVVAGAGVVVGGDSIVEETMLIGAGEGVIVPVRIGFGHGMCGGAEAEVEAGAGVGVIAEVEAGLEAVALGGAAATVAAAALVGALGDVRGAVNLSLTKKKLKVGPQSWFL